MKKKVFVLIPSDSPTGPVKGAYALANAVADYCDVTIVSLKKGNGAHTYLDNRVKFECLADKYQSLFKRIRAYKNMLNKNGGRESVVTVSMCFSADMANLLCRKDTVTCSSVRGNLIVNYRLDYGRLGAFLAMVHLFLLRWFDFVLAMNNNMAKQIEFFANKKPDIVRNFVNEYELEIFRSKVSNEKINFIFVGTLSARKRPWLIVRAIHELKEKGINAHLDIVGDGPLREKIEEEIVKYKLEDVVELHGFVKKPAELIAKANVMVLPSLSEGISRAMLEALYLGVPCVIRNSDGNNEIIENNVNGILFDDDNELSHAMYHAVSLENVGDRNNLLPPSFRQDFAARCFLNTLGILNE